MKTKFIIILVLLLNITAINANEKTNPDPSKFIGTWVLVSAKNGDAPEMKIDDSSPFSYQKQFIGTRFSAITYDKEGRVVRTIGGTYSYNDNDYIETIVFSTIKEMVNTKSNFKVEFIGNEMHIIGSIANGAMALKEVWKKVE